MIDLCDSILQKNNEDTILISKVFPKLEGRKVNQETMKFNWGVENHYIDNERVCFSANDNFAKSASIVERLFRGGNDTVHLSNEGIRLLSGNLINGLKRQYNVSERASCNFRSNYRKQGHYPRRPIWGVGGRR